MEIELFRNLISARVKSSNRKILLNCCAETGNSEQAKSRNRDMDILMVADMYGWMNEKEREKFSFSPFPLIMIKLSVNDRLPIPERSCQPINVLWQALRYTCLKKLRSILVQYMLHV